MRDLKKLNSMVKYLQGEIDKLEILDLQKQVCRRSIWYAVIKNYSLKTSEKVARRAYNLHNNRIKTREYTQKMFDEHLGKDYFNKKNKIKNYELYRNLESKL